MKVILKMGKNMDKAGSKLRMAVFIKECLVIIKQMVQGSLYIRMGTFTKERGLRGKDMVMEGFSTRIGLMQDSGRIIRSKDMELCIFKIIGGMKGCERMICKMGKASLY